VDVNGINKLAGEWYHILYNNVYGVRACALRLTNTYGPRMRVKDARQTFLGMWVKRLLDGAALQVFGTASNCATSPTWTTWSMRCCWPLQAARHDGQVYNVGGDCVVSLRELAEMLVAAHGSSTFTVRDYPAERKRIDIGDYYADDRGLRAVLGWQPATPLAAGLRRTVAYYGEHLAHYV
jgi:UDP-glucose 4-epimerase